MFFKGFIYIAAEVISEDKALRKQLNRGLAHVAALSPESFVHKKKRKS
jgi:hypothetical protein